LTRRANQGHINIIARILKARAEQSAAGFLFEVSESDGGRTSRRIISSPSPERRQRAAVRAFLHDHH
jgi:hypothetical protein